MILIKYRNTTGNIVNNTVRNAICCLCHRCRRGDLQEEQHP
jgi:hypothetical protein